jgi:hypothetical protein
LFRIRNAIFPSQKGESSPEHDLESSASTETEVSLPYLA